MQIIVTGTSNSGRHAVVRQLDLLGCHSGAKEKFSGETETFERVDVAQINQWLLQVTGASPSDPARFDSNGLSIHILDEFRQRSTTVLEELDSHRPWVLTDPLFAFTLPLWQLYLEDPLMIFVFSDPAAEEPDSEESTSFQRALWEVSACRSLAACGGRPTLFIDGGQARGNPFATAKCLRSALQESDPNGAGNLQLPDESSFSEGTEKIPASEGISSTLTQPQRDLLSYLRERSKNIPQFEIPGTEDGESFTPSAEALDELRRHRATDESSGQRVNGNDALRRAHEERLHQIEAFYEGKLLSLREVIAGEVIAVREEKNALEAKLRQRITEEEALRKQLQKLIESIDEDTQSLQGKSALSGARIKAALRVLRLGGQRSQLRASDELKTIFPDEER